jgi:hypothetical protein
MSKNHYVYYSYEEWGRGYIGIRSTKLDPLKDPYMGSFKDKSFKPTHKEIIAIFESRGEALEAEILLHNFYEVHINPHFANRSKQTSTGFTPPIVNPMLGRSHTEETKKKISEFRKTCVGEKASMYGKTHSEAARKKMSEFRKTCTGEKNPMYGRRGEDSPIFGITRNEETRKKMSEHAKRCQWWNDGTSIKRSPECPGPEWQLGMIKRRRV